MVRICIGRLEAELSVGHRDDNLDLDEEQSGNMKGKLVVCTSTSCMYKHKLGSYTISSSPSGRHPSHESENKRRNFEETKHLVSFFHA